MNFGGRLVIFQVLHVLWPPSARSVAAQCTFSGCPWHVQWLPMERASWKMVNFSVFLRIFVRFQLVFPILTCCNISWQKSRFSVVFEFFKFNGLSSVKNRKKYQTMLKWSDFLQSATKHYG